MTVPPEPAPDGTVGGGPVGGGPVGGGPVGGGPVGGGPVGGGPVRDRADLPRRWRLARSARQGRHPGHERRRKRDRPDRTPDIEDLLGPAEQQPSTEDDPVPDGSMLRDEGPWRHRDISANGIRFHIAEAGSGPLILLLHGFGQYWRSWRYQLPALAQAGFRVVAPDLRGYGDSDKTPRGYDAFTLADDVAGLVRSLGERDAVLVGQGYGGVTAFNTAVMNTAQVRGVVAIAAPHPIRLARIRRPVPTDRYGRLLAWAATPAWPERHLVAGNAALLERLVRSQSGPAWKASADFTETMVKMRQAIRVPGAARGAVEHLRWAGRSPLRTDGHRHRETLATPITAPVLHIVGDADRFTPPSALVDAREQCTGWYTLSTVRGVGHYPAEESPDVITGLIAGLARRADGPR